jgi:hypothetical protein
MLVTSLKVNLNAIIPHGMGKLKLMKNYNVEDTAAI